MSTPTTVQVKIQLRRDTAATWASVNPVLLAGEAGLETDTSKIKIGNGSTAWNSLGYFPFVVNGGTVTGNLEIGTTGTLTFEGSSANNFETTLGVINPTADRTINLPNQSGTVIVSGNATIVDADIAANAEIAVSKLADGAARQLLQTDAAGTGVEWTSNVDVPGTLDVTGAATFDAAVTIAGDLTVNGTTTNINTQNLVVKDKNIILADVASPTDVTADGGGITLKGATDKTITWSDTTDSWELNQPTITTGSSTAASFIPTSSTVPSNGVYLSGTNTVAVATNSTGRLFVDASGNVGVNNLSATPAGFGAGFIRAKSTNGVPGFFLENNTSASWFGMYGGADDTDSTAVIYPSTGYLRVATSTSLGVGGFSEKLRITSDGRVGLGSSAPQAELNVAKTGGAATVYIESDAGNNATTSILRFGGASGRSASIQGFRGASSNVHSLDFYTYNSADAFGMRLTPTGLGIGTTTVATQLEVVGGSSGSTTSLVQIRSNGAGTNTGSALRFLNSTDGTSTFGAAAITALRTDSGGSGTTDLFFSTGNGGTVSEKARLTGDGKLLVGTSSDSQVSTVVLQGSTSGAGNNSVMRLCRGVSTLADGDALGFIAFCDSGHTTASSIQSNRDGGTWTSGSSQPSRLVFSTTADGASSPTERMRISQNGTTTFTGNTVTNGIIYTHVTSTTAGVYGPDESNYIANNTEFQLIRSQNGAGVWGRKGGSNNEGSLILKTHATIGSPQTRLTISPAGAVSFNSIGTTASAANAFLDSAASNNLLRSTSSLRYKTDIEDLEQSRADSILAFRPVWYRSKAEADRKDWSWYGLIAEEVAEIEPRLVHWTYLEDAYEEIDGEQQLKPDAEMVPDGVQYDRLTVLLLDLVQRQQHAIEILEAKVAALEAS
jgi:hypothetical protein